MAQCPECEAMIDVDPDDVETGDVVTCPDCTADLEIISTDPLEFNLVDDIDERDEMDDDFGADDDDDDDDDEDEDEDEFLDEDDDDDFDEDEDEE